MASAMAFVACEQEKTDLGTPSIALSLEEVTLEAAGGEATVDVTATRDWTVKFDETADWLVVDPASGTASADAQQVTVSALSNEGYDREVSVEFSIGMQTKYLTVKQVGPKGSADELVVYSNDFDIVKADAKPDLDNNYDVWDNKKGTGSSTVSYAFGGKISARTTGKLSNNAEGYSHYEGSGMNKVFFGNANPTILKINDITLNGTTADYILSFGCQKYLQDGDSNFSWDEFKVYVGSDSQKWVPVTMAFPADADINGDWNLATANLTLPAGTTSLGIAFVSTCPSAYSLDDVCLAVGTEEGQTVDFSVGIAIDGTTSGNSGSTEDLPAGTGDGTLDSPYDAAKATKVASALADGETKNGVYVKGIVKSFKDVSGIAQYGNISYYITDASGAANFYVFRGKYLDNAKFTSEDQLKIGDEVVVYGDLINYMGNTPELAQGNYIVSLNSSTGGGNQGGGETPSIDEPASLVKATIAEFLAAAEDDTWYELSGEIVSIEAGNAYGNFTIKDDTDEVYIYGMTSKWVGSNDKSFASLGLKVTDVVTLGTRRGSHNGTPQGGGKTVPAYYISHQPGAGLPEDPSGTVELTFSAATQESAGSYTSDWSATIGTNSWRIVNFNNNSNQWSYIKCGHKSTSNTATITTKNALAGTITSVAVQVDKLIDATKCTTKLEVASDASFSNIVETVNVTIAQGAVNYALTTPRANCYYRLVFDCVGLGGNTNGNVQISKVKYLAAE